MIISGIVASKKVNLPAIASKVPTMNKVESQVKRFSRWIENENVSFEFYYLPYAQQLVSNLAKKTLVLVMDGSPVGHGCRTLMLCQWHNINVHLCRNMNELLWRSKIHI